MSPVRLFRYTCIGDISNLLDISSSPLYSGSCSSKAEIPHSAKAAGTYSSRLMPGAFAEQLSAGKCSTGRCMPVSYTRSLGHLNRVWENCHCIQTLAVG